MHTLTSNISTETSKRSTFVASEERARKLEEFQNILNIVAAAHGIDPELVLTNSRSRADVALCRQITMYIVHVVLGYTMTRTGRLFDRDRSTVGHACARIEDMRDDKDFDAALASLEQVLSFANVTRSAASRRLSQ